MIKPIGTFPFGQPVNEVIQRDRTPKHVFVLGVYASAVHARWINLNKKTVIKALAVASEPYIFWCGENAESIVQKIPIPKELGDLVPACQIYNGPSGRALDDFILNPLKLDRKEVWLCDLITHSCVNAKQLCAIKREYLPIAPQYGLVNPTVPSVPDSLTDENRRKAILNELIESESRVLILLGDRPIKWFLSYYDSRWSKLSDFGIEGNLYGQLHDIELGGKKISVLPLSHLRQIARIGQSSDKWYNAHNKWRKQSAKIIAKTISVI